MKVTMSGTSKVIRDFVNDHYRDNLLHISAIFLLSCADTIERLTKERDEALDLVKQYREDRKKGGCNL